MLCKRPFLAHILAVRQHVEGATACLDMHTSFEVRVGNRSTARFSVEKQLPLLMIAPPLRNAAILDHEYIVSFWRHRTDEGPPAAFYLGCLVVGPVIGNARGLL